MEQIRKMYLTTGMEKEMKTKITQIALLIVLMVMTACGPDDPQGTINCTEVEVENTTYCIVEEGIIVETGYQCPEPQGTLHTIEDVNVCSPDDVPPSEEVLKKIVDLQKRAKTNNTTLIDDRCERLADQRTMCGQTPRSVSACESDLKCRDDLMTPAAAAASIECLTTRECNASDDRCFDSESLGLSISAVATAHKEACLAKRETCSDFTDDFCFVGVINDAAIGEYAACVALPCDQIQDCLNESKNC